MSSDQTFLTVQEAASFLRTTKSYIYKCVHERRIPCYKPTGGRLLFSKAELENFVKAGRRATRRELDEQSTAILNRGGV